MLSNILFVFWAMEIKKKCFWYLLTFRKYFMIRRRVMKTHQCALDSAGLSISTLIMFTDDCRSFQAATGIREKTAHTRHHQKLEKGKKKENCLQVLCVFVGFSVLMLCAFLGGLLLIIALGAGLIGRAGLSTHCRTWQSPHQSNIMSIMSEAQT